MNHVAHIGSLKYSVSGYQNICASFYQLRSGLQVHATVNLKGARIIVAGGAGVGSKENFQQLYALAEANIFHIAESLD